MIFENGAKAIATCSRRLQLASLKLSIKYQCCGGSLQSSHQKNIRFDCKTALKILGTYLIILSHTPPICEAVGGLKTQRISFCCRNTLIITWFHFAIACLSSLSALVKLIPLSDLISWGTPLLAINLRRAFIKELVSRLWATALNVKRPRTVHANVRKWWLLRSNSLVG